MRTKHGQNWPGSPSSYFTWGIFSATVYAVRHCCCHYTSEWRASWGRSDARVKTSGHILPRLSVSQPLKPDVGMAQRCETTAFMNEGMSQGAPLCPVVRSLYGTCRPTARLGLAPVGPRRRCSVRPATSTITRHCGEHDRGAFAGGRPPGGFAVRRVLPARHGGPPVIC